MVEPKARRTFSRYAFPAISSLSLCMLIVRCGPIPQEELDDGMLRAASWGETRKVRRLLEKGANINARDKSGRTALMLAADENKIECVRLLLDNGADVNAKDERGWTALMESVDPIFMIVPDVYLEIVEMLLDSGADVNAKDDNGYTALIIVTASVCHRSLIERYNLATLLIGYGADVNTMTNDGCNALNYEYEPVLIKLLKDAGATGAGAECPPSICA